MIGQISVCFLIDRECDEATKTLKPSDDYKQALQLLAEVSTFMVIMACQVDVVWSITTVVKDVVVVNQLCPSQ